jgi:2',3'-cyclic-nucleotide 2'-phosphodiesterase (5'-nucleotidase family)
MLLPLLALVLSSTVGAQPARVQVLGINDFHGQLGTGRELLGRPVGSAAGVVSGHAHQFANAYFASATGSEILVTQAYSAGMAYADIELTVDRRSGEVVDKSAQIVPTFADEGPGLFPAADVAALEQAAEAKAKQLLAEVVGVADEPVTDVPSAAGESALGNLMADAERAASNAQIALVSQVAIRADMLAGPITMGRLLAVHPFGNVVVAMELSGVQLRRVLAQQWAFAPPHMLQVSGLAYSWDAALPAGERALAIRVGHDPLRDDKIYRVAVNDYRARGGGGFPAKLPAGVGVWLATRSGVLALVLRERADAALEHAPEERDFVARQVTQQDLLDVGRRTIAGGQHLAAGAGQVHLQHAAVLGSLSSRDPAVAVERDYDLVHGLRRDERAPRQLRG